MQAPTLRQLEYIVAVAETGQFSAAAQRCHVSQPALSKQVAAVEAQLDVILFERTRPRVSVTDAGAPLVEQARRVLSAARRLTELARGSQGLLQGRLRLGVIPTIAPYFLPRVLGPISAQFPELQLILHEAKTDDALASLRSGELDALLLALPVATPRLEGLDLVEERFAVVAPRDHALGEPTAVTRDAIAESELLLLDEGHCFRDHALEVCTLARAREQVDARASSMTTLALMVQHGVGATLMPAMAIDVELGRAVEQDRVIVRAFAGAPPRRRIGLRWRPTSPRAAALELLGRTLADAWDGLTVEREVHGPSESLRLRKLEVG